MTNKLYVANISWSATDEDLRALFETIGEVVEAKIITDARSGRSKGFGFVTMASEELAQRALQELNGKDLAGREIRVAEAKPQERRDDRPRRF